MATGELSDEQVFGKGFAYGPGAQESGQPVTEAQAAYARAAATSTDRGAPVGTPQNPSYDTPSATGAPDIYHVGPDGRMYDPVATAQARAGVRPMSEAEVLGPDFVPGQQFDTRPANQGLGAIEGAATVGKNVLDLLSAKLPGMKASPFAGAAYPLQVGSDLAGALAKHYFSGREKTERPGVAGKVGAELALTAPLMFTGEGAPLVMGGVLGDLTSESDDPMGRLRDIGVGAAGGKAGDMVAGAARSAIWPTIRPQAQWAIDNGIRLTPGGISGGVAKGVESGAAKGTIAGPIIGAAQRRGLEDFNLATARHVLDGVGRTLPEGLAAGHEAVNATQNLLSGAYNSLTPKLSLSLDSDLTKAISDATNAGTLMPSTFRTRLDNLIGQLPARGGPISGHAVQDITSQLRSEAADAAASGDFFAKDYGRTVGKLQSAVEDSLERTNPEQASELRALRTAWAKHVRVVRAARDAAQDGGVFTPKGLLAAVRASDQSVNDNATARGEALMQDWANNGKAVLPDKIPASGSIWQHLPELAVTLGVGKEAGLPGVAAMLAGEGAVGALYTEPMQRVLRAAMTARPPVAEPVADMVRRLTPALGQAGSATANKAIWPAIAAQLQLQPDR
jgi:hypothetical protein